MRTNVNWQRKRTGTRLSPKIKYSYRFKGPLKQERHCANPNDDRPELYGSKWHWRAANQLGQALDSFKLDLHDSTDEGKNMRGKEKNERPILLDEEESIRMKQKGARISYSDKVYLYTLMKKDKINKRVLASEYNLSLETLYNIMNEFDCSAPQKHLDKSG